MKKRNVGKIKNIKVNEDTQDIEVTFSITDPKFKKKLLRDLSLAGELTIENGKLIFTPQEDK